ncbi:hypothetical protein Q5424_00160 [Conexibacter sp. JD483]|uniref:hypothetical protein n=1 Tax=unclassified Conexibacter TaxID=2627773 RepID=UPI002718CDD1|nr:MULTISPECIES: hypothetical protein [unclassified Conexibacter]MDO8184222.1 hypothetical protein [Conexibacter sp. CPCC 205706]MDO8197214.1 hypothetical protein [Conexibacter sp. CPCC 205762]MDR9367471.1 hypothetical protein [Conexibacter sp. JD483]
MSVFKTAGVTVATALAFAACLLAPTLAGARTSAALSGAVTPAITGFPTTPQNVSLTLEGRVVGDDIDGAYPATTRRITLWFTHGARVNGRWFASCRAARLIATRGSRSACPKASRIGGGWAFGTAISVTARLQMEVYNGPGGRSMLFYFHATNPVEISELIDARFEQLRGNPRYGFKLTLPVPPGLQEISDGMVTSLRQFKATVGGATVKVREHGRTVKRGYIEAMTCPPGARVIVRGLFEFNGGVPSQTVDSYLGCGQGPPFAPEFPPSVAGSD